MKPESKIAVDNKKKVTLPQMSTGAWIFASVFLVVLGWVANNLGPQIIEAVTRPDVVVPVNPDGPSPVVPVVKLSSLVEDRQMAANISSTFKSLSTVILDKELMKNFADVKETSSLAFKLLEKNKGVQYPDVLAAAIKARLDRTVGDDNVSLDSGDKRQVVANEYLKISEELLK